MEHVKVIREGDDVEAIFRTQTCNGHLQCFAGLADRRATHRAGNILHKDNFAGLRFLCHLANFWRGYEGEQVIFTIDFFFEKGSGRLGQRFGCPNEFKIAIGWHRSIETHLGGVAFTFDVHWIMRRRNFGERKACIEGDFQRHGVMDPFGFAGIEDRRLDFLAVGNGIVDRPSTLTKVDHLYDGLRIVTRRDDERHPQTKCTVFWHKRLLKLDLRDDDITRPNVCDLIREEVWTLLFNQRSLATFGLGALVSFSRFFPFFDLSFDEPITNAEFQPVHGGVGWQGEGIHPLDPLFAVITEFLRDRGAQNWAGNVDLNIRRER